MSPESRYYRNGDETIGVVVLERKPAEEWSTAPEGRLYVEITVEALEMLLERAGFHRAAS